MERIPLEVPGLDLSTNAYLLDGERPALVDPGIAWPTVREQLDDGLARHGVGVEDLEVILLTHWHADHAGLTGALQRESGATVRAHPGDAGLVAVDEDARERFAEVRDRLMDECGTPPEKQEEMATFFDAIEDAEGETATVEPLADGERIRAGDEILEAVHAPGHTIGATCYVREDGSVLTGDVLLPEKIPSLGGVDPRVDDAIETYLDSLQELLAADYARAYPGHGGPIDDPAGRAREIQDSHVERAGRLLDVLDDSGPATAWTVSTALFDDVSRADVLHRTGEVGAQLGHMRDVGLVDRTDEGYVSQPDARNRLDDVLP